MKRIKSSYHKLHSIKDAKPKLRKAIISNCDRELVNSISECGLNVLRGNVKLTVCQKKRLKKFKGQLRTVVGKRVPLPSKKRHKSARLLPRSTLISSSAHNTQFYLQ